MTLDYIKKRVHKKAIWWKDMSFKLYLMENGDDVELKEASKETNVSTK